MLLTSRDKPLYINPAHIVALTPCSSTERDTIGANCCIYLTHGSFLVRETFEQVYLKVTGETILFSNVIVQPVENNPVEEPLHIDTDYATFKAPSRRPRRPQ
jgi:hypothetical protein